MDMQGTCVALDRELNKLLVDKNVMTISEFLQYLPLFKKDSDKTTASYVDLCEQWKHRISIFHKVSITADHVDREGRRIELFVLPPMFTRVNALNDGNEQSSLIVTMLSNAIASNNPLRTDVEETLDLMNKAINIAQCATKDRLLSDAGEYATIVDNLKPYLTTSSKEPIEDEKIDTNELDWN